MWQCGNYRTTSVMSENELISYLEKKTSIHNQENVSSNQDMKIKISPQEENTKYTTIIRYIPYCIILFLLIIGLD